jgi:hypothetical protein
MAPTAGLFDAPPPPHAPPCVPSFHLAGDASSAVPCLERRVRQFADSRARPEWLLHFAQALCEVGPGGPARGVAASLLSE